MERQAVSPLGAAETVTVESGKGNLRGNEPLSFGKDATIPHSQKESERISLAGAGSGFTRWEQVWHETVPWTGLTNGRAARVVKPTAVCPKVKISIAASFPPLKSGLLNLSTSDIWGWVISG